MLSKLDSWYKNSEIHQFTSTVFGCCLPGFWLLCYLGGLQVKHICLFLKFSDTQHVITSSSYLHAWCLCPGFLMSCHASMPLSRPVSGRQGLSKHAGLSRRAFVSRVRGLDVAFPPSKRAASSPRGLRCRIVVCSQYGVCVCSRNKPA